MTDLYMIVTVLAVVIAGLFGVPYITKKGWLKQENIDGVKKALEIAALVVQVVDAKKLDKTKANFILSVADIATDYVDSMYSTNTKVDKRVISLEVVSSILEKYGVKPSIQEQQLIEVVIDEALKFADNKVK